MAQNPLNFANPIATPGAQISPGANPGVQYSAGQDPTGRTGFGYLTNDQTGTDQWGTGGSFQGAGRQAVIGALQGSMSNSNPLDTQGMDEARQSLRNQLAGLPGLAADKNSTMDTSMQRGLQNLLSQQRSGAAGTGTLGSRQYGGAAGDITARVGSDYMNGLIQNRADAINQSLNLTNGLGGIQSGDLAQRQFQLNQGQALSGGYMGLLGLDANRQSQLQSEQFQNQQNDKNMLNNDLMGIAKGGAMLATGGAAAAPLAMAGAAGAGGGGAPTNTGTFYNGSGNGGYSVGGASGMYNPNSSGYGFGGY